MEVLQDLIVDDVIAQQAGEKRKERKWEREAIRDFLTVYDNRGYSISRYPGGKIVVRNEIH